MIGPYNCCMLLELPWQCSPSTPIQSNGNISYLFSVLGCRTNKTPSMPSSTIFLLSLREYGYLARTPLLSLHCRYVCWSSHYQPFSLYVVLQFHSTLRLLRNVTAFCGRYGDFQHSISCCFGYLRIHQWATMLHQWKKFYLQCLYPFE
jgi:hypothetical protein